MLMLRAAGVGRVEHFIEVGTVLFTGAAIEHLVNELVIEIDAGTELVAVVTSLALRSVLGVLDASTIGSVCAPRWRTDRASERFAAEA